MDDELVLQRFLSQSAAVERLCSAPEVEAELGSGLVDAAT